MRWAARSLALALAVVLFGCTAAPAPTTHHYRLEAGDPTPLPRPALVGTLLVRRPRADAFTAQRGVVSLRSDTEGQPAHLHRSSRHRWVDPPPQMLEQEFARYLRGANAADTVITAEVQAEPTWLLETRIQRFHYTQVPAGTLTAIDFNLVRVADGGLVLQQSYRIESPAAAESVSAYAAAHSEAVTQMLGQLVEALREVSPGS